MGDSKVLPDIFAVLSALGFFLLSLALPQPAIIPFLAAAISLFPYYRSIFKALRKRQIDMSFPPIVTIYLLIFIGKGNIAELFILIILLGHLFKSYILEKVKDSVSEISNQLPKTAVIHVNGVPKTVNVADITVGSILMVKTGERIACDSLLLSDNAILDESVVTGESRAVTKEKQDKLLAGSINTGNYLEAEVTKTASNSTVFQIERLVYAAQHDKTPLAKSVSRYAWGTIVFALLGMLLIFLLTDNLLEAISFWIAVVPVIFAIITPVATTIGISILAREGVLVKNSTALEYLTKKAVFLLDKTGTLTYGTPEVVAVLDLKGGKQEIFSVAVSLERYANHPFSGPILKEGERNGVTPFPVSEVQTVAGEGMVAKRNGSILFAGNLALLQKYGIQIPQDLPSRIARWERQGATPVFIGEGTNLLGVIFLQDRLRPDIRPLFSYLSKNGSEVCIVTGDRQEIAEATIGDLPHSRIFAGVFPEGKVAIADGFIREGKNVVVVGDGINDAPALAKANVGIAMGGKGLDLPLVAADIVLVHDDLRSLPFIIDTAIKIFRTVRQDVIIATGIHVVNALLVLAGVFNIFEATILHEISSVIILSLTLRLFSIRKVRGLSDSAT